jgi:hypothetical protein
MSECQSKIRRFNLSTDVFTPIIAPGACSYFAILGTDDGSAMIRSSDPSNPSAWYTMIANQSYGLIVPHQGAGMKRFGEGETVTWLKSEGGIGPVIVEFI